MTQLKCEHCDFTGEFPIDLTEHMQEWHGMNYENEVHEELPLEPTIRTFESGATRDTDEHKIDYEGFLSPKALKAFGEYMHKNRLQADGSLRASDNWQKGIPVDAYMKSMWRHFFAVWEGHRKGEPSQEDLCALLFNVQGMLHELLREDA